MLNNLTLENDIFINECKIPWDRSSIRLDYSFEFKKSSQEAQFSHVMTDMETFYNWNILKIFILLMITILVANWSFTIFSESKQPYQYFYHFLLLVSIFSILLVMICILDFLGRNMGFLTIWRHGNSLRISKLSFISASVPNL